MAKSKTKPKREITQQTRDAAIAASKGNQWWKLRSKHGRDKLFKSPELMREAAYEYFQWCEDNPFIELKPMAVSIGMNSGSEIEMVEIPVKRPFTMQGICRYLDCAMSYFRQFKSAAEPKKDKDFLTIIEEIEQTIYDQKFSGAASGFFNANIIARDLGLKDSQDVNLNDNRKAVADAFPEGLGE